VCAPEVSDHLASVVETFARAGARIEDLALPPAAQQIDEAGRVILAVEAAAYHRQWFPAHADAYAPRIRELVETGLRVSGVDLALAERTRQRFRQEMAPIFARYDALLMPAAPAPAPPLALRTTGDPVLCAPWTFGGFPAIAIPSGLSAAGLPVAIQLVAGPHAEPRLLDVARWCERLLGFTAAPSL